MPPIRWGELSSTDANQVLPDKSAITPRGTLYDDIVPDTLDLAEVAKNYIKGMTGSLMKRHSLTPPGFIHFYGRPRLEITAGPVNWGKTAQALVMARRMSGYDLDDKDGSLTIQYQSFKNMIDLKVNNQLNQYNLGAWIVSPNRSNIAPMTFALEALIELYKQSPQSQLELL
jgi:hypothetical protein